MRPLLKYAFALGALCLMVGASAPAAQADPIVLGHVDTFEGPTTEGWRVGDPNHPAPPAVVAGGPAGAVDHFLRLIAVGGGGPGSHLAAFNTAQWAGDYVAGGVNAIVMDVSNFGPDDLHLRLLFADPLMGPPSNLAFSTSAVFVPAGSGWIRVTFLVGPGDLTAPLGDALAALTNATELRIFHNPVAAFPGPGIGPAPVAAQLGVDNITASAVTPVPEPTTMLLLGTGLAGVVGALRRRRKTVNS